MSEYSQYLSSIEEIIEDAKNGRMFILVDDEDRENEGDLVIPAQTCDADAVNFMATHGRGLICLAMTGERIDHLGLPLMTTHNASRHETAFTISIEAREGVTTGISAGDRALTIKTAIDVNSTRADIATPGHVFPLRARDGGVLVRAGHTEASVDVARLAGLDASGVICEIMNDDGTMARMPDLVEYAKRLDLKIATIADLIAYRRKHDRIIEKKTETKLNSIYGGEFEMRVYTNNVEYAEHVALIKGDITTDEPVMVRMHALNVLDDVLGDHDAGKEKELHNSMRHISEVGRGVIVLLREPQRSSLSERVEAHATGRKPSGQLRDYGTGAQILLDLGISDMILLSNSERKNIIGLDGYGLAIVDQQTIPAMEE
ncbi:Riboflavin biosynthesis protein RibBA (Includes: 3,4-dihydroxy-2-butanone 4-phosphate synthase; GTP cyclohydrolase-2) [Candidatus Terasakiella magnetica]|uniref:3,4-dihydroxy-2-butanone 4-phosphate synthase n=1 Tax=Candidatus Terasakiella magnetica TaxID=1867952 RepID=A0A1C3RD30_9PROT|nr:Riboflavin biosynthesis protein RibBA (Includes: 3,4-dihydroxy-2-butanone 4-phosphate synthase; GTP cyclohydrolase-2) [Candidatus Terasakiella magnetica]